MHQAAFAFFYTLPAHVPGPVCFPVLAQLATLPQTTTLLRATPRLSVLCPAANVLFAVSLRFLDFWLVLLPFKPRGNGTFCCCFPVASSLACTSSLRLHRTKGFCSYCAVYVSVCVRL